MLANYLIKVTELPWPKVSVCLFVPLAIIIDGLVIANSLEKTFLGMGGVRYLRRVDDLAPKERDRRLAEKSDNPLSVAISGELRPVFLTTPRGEVRAYSQFSIGYNSETPKGYVVIKDDDPEYFPPGILMTVLRPLSTVATWGIAPAFLYFLWCIVENTIKTRKPEDKQPPTESQAS